MGIGVGMLAFSQLASAPYHLEESMDDVPVISEAQTRTSDTANYYIPLSAHYAVAQGTYDVGQSDQTLDSQSNIDNHYDQQRGYVDGNATDIVSSYTGTNSFIRCDVEIPEKEIVFGIEDTVINITNQDGSQPFVETVCRDAGDISTVEDERSLEQKNASNIRFHQIMTMTLEGIQGMQDKAEKVESNNNYEGSEDETGSQCSTSYSTAKSGAEDSAEGNAEDAVDNLVETLEDRGKNDAEDADPDDDDGGIVGIIKDVIEFLNPWSSDEFDIDFSEQSRSEKITLDTSSATRSGVCPCEKKCSCPSPPCGCCRYEYSGDATYDWELQEVTIESTISDDQIEIPVDDGWYELEVVRDWYYNFPT